jgi:SOS-response transcriptional repressor LexA
MLVAANPSYQPLYINADDDFHIWGVVTQVLHNLPRGTTPLGSFLITT